MKYFIFMLKRRKIVIFLKILWFLEIIVVLIFEIKI